VKEGKFFLTKYGIEARELGGLHQKLPAKFIEVLNKRASAKVMDQFNSLENQDRASK